MNIPPSLERKRDKAADEYQGAFYEIDHADSCFIDGWDACYELMKDREVVAIEALKDELGVWKYDKEYSISNYSRIHVDLRIEAITKSLTTLQADDEVGE